MGRTKSKEKFRQGKKKKLYSKQIQGKMRELKQQGKSREKICEILKVPLVDERSFTDMLTRKMKSTSKGRLRVLLIDHSIISEILFVFNLKQKSFKCFVNEVNHVVFLKLC